MTEITANETTATDAKTAKAKDFTAYVAKKPTSLHEHYAAWMLEKTGLELNVQSDDVTKIVQLAVSLYHDYQASPENKARREAEQASKPAKTPSKVKQELANKDAEIQRLKAELEAAKATPANGAPAATATGEASAKPVGRRTVAKK